MWTLIKTYLRALAQAFTYDARRNAYLWFGILWGLPIPLFAILFDRSIGDASRSWVEVLTQHPIHFLLLAHPVIFGIVFGAMGTVRRDLEAENARLIARLTDMAEIDPLTQLRNRRVVLEALRQGLFRAERNHHEVSVVMFDLDGFKAINDRQGHCAGDETLRKVAVALATVVRHGEVLGRYGGDEFLLVANDSLPDAPALIERARQAIEVSAGLSVSAGVARWPQDGRTPEELVQAADDRLRQNKRFRYETRAVRRTNWTDGDRCERA